LLDIIVVYDEKTELFKNKTVLDDEMAFDIEEWSVVRQWLRYLTMRKALLENKYSKCAKMSQFFGKIHARCKNEKKTYFLIHFEY
jgi:hypothetical protein